MNKFLMLMFFPLSLFAQINIGIIGDSISYGKSATKDKGWVTLLEEDLQKEGRIDVNIINKSVCGLTTEEGKKIFYSLLKEAKIDILIIALGVNDANAGFTNEQVHNNLGEMIKVSRKNNIKFFLGFVDPSYVANLLHNKSDLSNFKYLYFDLFISYPFITLFPFMNPPLMTRDDFHPLPDRIHPNDKGHEYLKNVIKYYLKYQLEEKREKRLIERRCKGLL